ARAHKSGSLARLHVLELDDLERIAVVEDLEPVAKFAGVVDLCQVTPPREPAMYRKPAGPSRQRHSRVLGSRRCGLARETAPGTGKGPASGTRPRGAGVAPPRREAGG